MSNFSKTPLWRPVIALLCLLWPAVSDAQRSAPTTADNRARLHSTNPADVAWAAFDAATFRMGEVGPDLVAVLERPPAVDPLSQDYLVAAVLDALIQLDDPLRIAGITPVPSPQILERYYARWPVQTLILFGRTGDERGPLLQALLVSASGDRWFALANLLSSQPPVPGFAATLLHGIKLKLEIIVVDPGSGAGFGEGGGRCACGGPNIEQGPSGFPPHALYNFESGDVPRAIVMSRGPRTVYYSRRVVTGGIPRGGRIGEGPTTEDRLAYLNALIRAVNYARPPLLRARISVSIGWDNAAAFLSRVALERQKIAAEYDVMLSILSETGYLTADEAAGLRLPLELGVHDLRQRNRDPLPDVTVLIR